MSNIHTGTCPDAGMVLFSFWNGLEGGDSRMSWCRVGYKNPAFQCRKFLTDRQTERQRDSPRQTWLQSNKNILRLVNTDKSQVSRCRLTTIDVHAVHAE